VTPPPPPPPPILLPAWQYNAKAWRSAPPRSHLPHPCIFRLKSTLAASLHHHHPISQFALFSQLSPHQTPTPMPRQKQSERASSTAAASSSSSSSSSLSNEPPEVTLLRTRVVSPPFYMHTIPTPTALPTHALLQSHHLCQVCTNVAPQNAGNFAAPETFASVGIDQRWTPQRFEEVTRIQLRKTKPQFCKKVQCCNKCNNRS
jgi:hypothetical protein